MSDPGSEYRLWVLYSLSIRIEAGPNSKSNVNISIFEQGWVILSGAGVQIQLPHSTTTPNIMTCSVNKYEFLGNERT